MLAALKRSTVTVVTSPYFILPYKHRKEALTVVEMAASVKTPLEIPLPYRQLFAHYEQFNVVQSALLDDLLYSDRSVVLSAPTGAGKTVAFELALVRLLQQHQTQVTDVTLSKIPPKAVYVAPLKALCAERFNDWRQRLLPLGVACVQITGDSEFVDLQTTIRGVQLIVTTPEKWDSLTRRWRDCCEIVGAVRLFMIDEVHLLNEEERGPILEAIVSRMRTVVRTVDSTEELSCLRFVIASASIPNSEDLTSWIGGGDRSNVTQLVFGDSMRPCPLEKHILVFNSRAKGFQFDMSLNYKLADILRKYSEHKATLIFCNSRKSAEMAATTLVRDFAGIFSLSGQQKTLLTQHSQRLQDIKLRQMLANGVAVHHAGMTYDDRKLVEKIFRCGLLLVLLCTSTLAMGVNLPAHLVVIKSTEYYYRGIYQEYAESTLLQMIGRAGRPQYDTKGVAVIMTHSRNVQKYENLMNGKQPIESHLHKHLAEHLNSEIALNTINNLEMAMNWIRSTYLYVRSVRNPVKYGFDATNMDKDIVESKLEEMCLVQINALSSVGLITRNGLDVQTTAYGKLMAKYYLTFETMKLFRQIRGTESLLEILNMIVRCKEFAEFTLRVNEKKTLNELNNSPIRFPISGRIKSKEDKISCLIQAVLGNVQISPPGLSQESIKMLRIGDRVAKCLLEYLRLPENNHSTVVLREYSLSATEESVGSYKALLHAVTIAKCFHAKLWENSEYAAKQLRKIGVVYSNLLANAGKTSLKSIAMTDAHTIELILNKPAPFGDEVLQHLQTFPEYSIKISSRSADIIHVYVRQINENFVYNGSNSMVIVGDSENNLLWFQENIDSILLECGFLERTIKIKNLQVEQINAHIIHSTLVGVDQCASTVINIHEEKLNTPAVTKKTSTKRKRQSTLNISMIKKKKFLYEKEKEAKHSIIDVSEIPDDSFLLSLNKFCLTKPKLQKFAPKICNNSKRESIVDNQKTVVLNDKLNTDILEMNRKALANNSTLLVQPRVTDYFLPSSIISQDMSKDISNDIAKFNAIKDQSNKTTLDITMSNQKDMTIYTLMPKVISMKISTDERKEEETKDTIMNSLEDISKDISMDLTNSKVQNTINKKVETTKILRNVHPDIPINILEDKTMSSISDVSIKPLNLLTPDVSMNLALDVSMESCSNIFNFKDISIDLFTETSNRLVFPNDKQGNWLDLYRAHQNLRILDSSRGMRQSHKNSLKSIKDEFLKIEESFRAAANSTLDFSLLNFNKANDFNLSEVTSQNKNCLNIPLNNPLTAVVIPSQKSKNSPSTDCFRLWFKVALSFQKLQPAEQNLLNFMKTYETIILKKDLQQRRHSSAVIPNDVSRVPTTCKNTTNTTNAINCKNKKNLTSTSKIKKSSISQRYNPYRLCIYKDNDEDLTNGSVAEIATTARDLSRSGVQSLNASVMQDVLNIKYKQNNQITDDTLSEFERELLLESEQQFFSASLREYFRLIMSEDPKA